MFTSKLNTSKLSKGFTLIELLVVIAIIGILSSVVLASMNSARKKSRDSRRQQDLKGLATALELSFDQAGAYPLATTAGGTRIIPATGPVTGSVLNALVTGSFLSQLQDDPLPTASNYYYMSDASGTSYCLAAKMEGTPPTPADTCAGTALDITSGTVNYWVGP
jgi:prepilin-type N-terminal cleavage/methylation domain-containing protein